MNIKWIKKLIHWKLCKQLHFIYKILSIKMYSIQKDLNIIENEIYKISWDLNLNESPNQGEMFVVCLKKSFTFTHAAVPVDHRINLKKRIKVKKNLNLAKIPRKLRNRKLTVVPIFIWFLVIVTMNIKKAGGTRNQRVDHHCDSTTKIRGETWSREETCGHMCCNENHQLLFVWKSE